MTNDVPRGGLVSEELPPEAPEALPGHTHEAVDVHVVEQRAGVPYTLERTTCAECGALLAEHPLRRASA